MHSEQCTKLQAVRPVTKRRPGSTLLPLKNVQIFPGLLARESSPKVDAQWWGGGVSWAVSRCQTPQLLVQRLWWQICSGKAQLSTASPKSAHDRSLQ